MLRGVSLSRIGFLLTAFLFPALIGTFASFSIPAPLVDVMHQSSALDAVLAAQNTPAEAGAIANLPNVVDVDTAALVADGTGPLPARVQAARRNMWAEGVRQARNSAYNIRAMVITMSVLGAIFGVALLGARDAQSR